MTFNQQKLFAKKILRMFIAKHFPQQELVELVHVKSFVNDVYSFKLANQDEFILKINNPRWPLKLEREVEAISLIAKHTTIPVPKIYTKSPPKAEATSYVIMEKCPGETLEQLLQAGKVTRDAFLEILFQVGRFIGELRHITFDFYGDFSSSRSDCSCSSVDPFWGHRFPNFKLCLHAFCKGVLHWLDSYSFPRIRNRLLSTIPYYLQQIVDSSSPCLVHADIHPSNLLIHGTTITALLDFEWAFAGTSSFDLALAKAGFYFSSFPSLTSRSIFSSPLFQIDFETINRVITSGYRSRSTLSESSYPRDFAEFVWLLYLIGSWSHIALSSPPDEVARLKSLIRTLSSKFI